MHEGIVEGEEANGLGWRNIHTVLRRPQIHGAYSRRQARCAEVTGMERWQRKRCAVNQDLLKNQFMPALAKLINVLDGRVVDPTFHPAFLKRLQEEWDGLHADVDDRLRSFEKEMSPRRLFERLPLANCSPQVAGWLPCLIHELWLSREPVRQRTVEGVGNLTGADRADSAIMKELDRVGSAPSMDDLRRMRSLFVEFRERCQALGSAVSNFRAEIKAA